MAVVDPAAVQTEDTSALSWGLFGVGFAILMFVAGTFAAATLQMWLGARPGPLAVAAGAAAAVAATIGWTRRRFPDRGRAAAASLLAVATAVVGGSTFVCGRVLDTTFDGQWYHQEAVVRLAEGWNPPRHELTPADYGDDRARVQLNGYPKASWLWGTALSRTAGSVEHAKSLSIPLAVAAFALTAAALIGLGRISTFMAVVLAAAAAANPIVITQSLNTQLDGDLASVLLAAAASLVLAARSRRSAPLATLAIAVAIAVNLKLTGAIFAVIVLGGGLGVMTVMARRLLSRRLVTAVAGGFVLGGLVLGWHPFVTNTVRHGHPLYPIMGPDKRVLIEPAETSRVALWAWSAFAPSHQFPSSTPADEGVFAVPLKPPFSVSAEEIEAFVYPDLRSGGWGPLFGGMVLLAAAALALAAVADRRLLALGALAVAVPFVSVIIFPHPYFARFVAHGWLIPLVVVPVVLQSRFGPARLAAAATVVAALANSSLVATGYLPATIRHSELTASRLATLRRLPQPLELDLRPFPSNRARLREMGLEIVATRNPARRLQLVVGRHQPKITTIEPLTEAGAVLIDWRGVAAATSYQVEILEPPPAGPGGGALAVVSRTVDRPPAILPAPKGTIRVMVAPCNLVGCGPSEISRPVRVHGVERLEPEIGSPEDGSTVAAGTVLLSWLEATTGQEAEESWSHLVEVVNRRTGFPVATSATDDHFFGVHLPPGGSWLAHVAVQRPGSLLRFAESRFDTAESVAPTPVTPAAYTSVPEAGSELGWTPVKGARGYEYLVTVPGERTPAARGFTDGLSVMVELPAREGRPTTYHAIMRTCFADDRCGSGVGWSPWSSEVEIPPLVFTVTPAEASPEAAPR